MYNETKDGLTEATKETIRLGNEIDDKTNIVNNLTELYNETKDGLTEATKETIRLGNEIDDKTNKNNIIKNIK